MEIRSFIFNPFRVNTYVLYDNTGECIIVDAGCHEKQEISSVLEFIDAKNLKPKALLNTHGHVDHICGNRILMEYFKLPLFMHRDDLFFVGSAVQHGLFFGFTIQQPPSPTGFLEEGDKFDFGHSSLEVMQTPGHSPGSLIFYSRENNFILSGDVLFSGGIGRTDLQKGNYMNLIRSIKSKILTLPGETKVFPGHENSTTVGREKETNPFLQGSF